MQIILGVIFIVILMVLLSQANILTARGKTLVFTILMMIVAGAMLYEFMFSKTAENNRMLINAFKQGKNLTCKDVPVNQTSYNLETGTQSFMAKESEKDIVGAIYAIEDCKLQE